VDYSTLIEKRQLRLSEIEEQMSAPDFFNDQRAAAQITREHSQIKRLLETWETLNASTQELEDNRELVKEDDEELALMAAEEIPRLEELVENLTQEVQYSLLPQDPAENRDALVEIRAGAGGDEAAIFAGDLLRIYQRYAETQGWKCEHLSSSPSETGGFKDAVIKLSGEDVFRYMKYESGVHRVQRVPATETQGRIHTSTASVAVLPEAEEVDVELKQTDLRIETCRAGGAGGQHVNKTESAVQILHIPSNTMVRCEDGRSQTQNKEKAMQILLAKLFEKKQQEQADAYSAQRRSLIGSADRSEKIRTYNYPQSRITDHRINFTSHQMDAVLNGDISEFVTNMQKAEMETRLKEAQLD